MNVPAPVIRWVGAHPNNFTVGRPGGSIGRRETFHHIVGSGTAAENTFNNPNRVASAHYSVDWDGEIRQHVDVRNTAYSDGLWASNIMTISVEHAGGGGGINYTDAMYEAAAHLRAWLKQTYGPLVQIRHREISATACPGGLEVERIVNRAEALIQQYATPVPPPQPEWLLKRQELGEFKVYAQKEGLFIRNLNNPSQPADSRRFPLNQDFTITGQTNVGGRDYYITRSSMEATIANGIDVSEVARTPYVAPTPDPVPQPQPETPKWEDSVIDDENRTMYVLRATPLINLSEGRVAKDKSGKDLWYQAGDIVENISAHTIIDGVTYQLTEYSFGLIEQGKAAFANGITSSDLTIDPKATPEGTPANPTPEEPVEPQIPEEPTEPTEPVEPEQPSTPSDSKLVEQIRLIVALIVQFLKDLGGGIIKKK